MNGEIVTNKKATRINRIIYGKRAVERDSYQIVLSRKNKVNINAWVKVNDEGISNIGDKLSLIITQYMCEKNGIDINNNVKGIKHLYAIGSILMGYKTATIWVSGFGRDYSGKLTNAFYGIQHKLLHRIDIRAVRGPETRRILQSMNYHCPEVYGDPAVLLPLFYKSGGIQSTKYVIIPHYRQCKEFKGYDNVLNTFCKDWKEFIDRITETELVISSSLHGIILAEAYGIPAIMLSKGQNDDITKYRDWYYSTGRYEFPIVHSIEEALITEPVLLDETVLRKMQDDLLNSFPVDLWE